MKTSKDILFEYLIDINNKNYFDYKDKITFFTFLWKNETFSFLQNLCILSNTRLENENKSIHSQFRREENISENSFLTFVSIKRDKKPSKPYSSRIYKIRLRRV